MKQFFNILSVLFTLLFLVSAGLQYNDPDPIFWILIYGMAALLSVLFFFEKISFWVLLIAGIVSFVGSIYLFPSNFQGFGLDDGDLKTVELAREAVGLLIISLIMFVYAFRIRFLQKNYENI